MTGSGQANIRLRGDNQFIRFLLGRIAKTVKLYQVLGPYNTARPGVVSYYVQVRSFDQDVTSYP